MRRILIVPEALASVLPTALRDRPTFEVRTAEGPAQVMETTQRWPPELVIIGAELSEDEAVALARRLRADRRLAGVKVLLVSDAVPVGPAGPVVHAQVDAHVVGPRPADLLRAVGMLLDVSTHRTARLPAEVLTRVTVETSRPGPEEPMLANLLGLTETSLQLECAAALATGVVVRVEMALPGGDPVELRAIVLSADELQLHYACEVIDSSAGARQRIRTFLGAGDG